MSTSVMGLPFASGQRGVALTSRVLVRIAGKSLPSLPTWVRVAFVVEGCCEGGAVEDDRCCCSDLIGVPAFAALESEEGSFLDCALWFCQRHVLNERLRPPTLGLTTLRLLVSLV